MKGFIRMANGDSVFIGMVILLVVRFLVPSGHLVAQHSVSNNRGFSICIFEMTRENETGIPEAVSLIRSKGGIVSTVVSGKYFVGMIQDGTAASLIRTGWIKSIHVSSQSLRMNNDHLGERAIGTFFEHQADSRFRFAESRDFETKVPCCGPVDAAWRQALEGEKDTPRFRTTRIFEYDQFYTSEKMAGLVASALLFIESDSLHNPDGVYWEEEMKMARINDAILGYLILTENAKRYGVDLTFILKVYDASTTASTSVPYDLLNQSSSGLNPAKTFVKHVLSGMGFTGEESYEGMLSSIERFNHMLRTSLKSDQAISTFLYRKQSGLFAVGGENYTMMTYRENYWTDFPNLVAHETSHCFGAFDEHIIDVPPCNWKRNGVENLNKLTSPCNGSERCLMRNGGNSICSFTAAHLGWNVTPPQPSLTFPIDFMTLPEGNITLQWNRNTNDERFFSKVTILDGETGAIVYHDSNKSSDTSVKRIVSLVPGTYHWFVANGGGLDDDSWAHSVSPSGTFVAEKVTNVRENFPSAFSDRLFQNHPNPFNPKTTVPYSVGSSGVVLIRIVDMLGRTRLTPVNEEKQPGRYSIELDTTGWNTGVYVCVMRTNTSTAFMKFVLVK